MIAVRLFIGDSLCNESGHRIDYIDPGYGLDPRYLVMHDKCPVLMTPHFDVAYDCMHQYPWQANNFPKPAGVPRKKRHGAEDNPIWDHPIGNFSYANNSWFFEPSPHTGKIKQRAVFTWRKSHSLSKDKLRMSGKRNFVLGGIVEAREGGDCKGTRLGFLTVTRFFSVPVRFLRTFPNADGYKDPTQEPSFFRGRKLDDLVWCVYMRALATQWNGYAAKAVS